jgi:hypothetical protein
MKIYTQILTGGQAAPVPDLWFPKAATLTTFVARLGGRHELSLAESVR